MMTDRPPILLTASTNQAGSTQTPVGILQMQAFKHQSQQQETSVSDTFICYPST
jgi:hypothetical protein